MRVHDPTRPTALLPETAACLGVFDGLHPGHQALLATAREVATRIAVVTFEPHPMRFLHPERAPRRLQTPRQRDRVLQALGVDELVVLPFDAELAASTPERFVQKVLSPLRPFAVVVGADFRFGRDRTGDATTLTELLAPAGIATHVVPEVTGSDGNRVSSSTVRAALERGDVATAARILGRLHVVSGVVCKGARRGRSLGFPTANLQDPESFVPREGVYGTLLVIRSPSFRGPRVLPSVTNVGRNPTFSGSQPLSVETHALDVDLGDDLYGLEIDVAFVGRLRDEQRFAGPQALVRQIHDDIVSARGLLREPPAPLFPADSGSK